MLESLQQGSLVIFYGKIFLLIEYSIFAGFLLYTLITNLKCAKFYYRMSIMHLSMLICMLTRVVLLLPIVISYSNIVMVIDILVSPLCSFTALNMAALQWQFLYRYNIYILSSTQLDCASKCVYIRRHSAIIISVVFSMWVVFAAFINYAEMMNKNSLAK